jgi:hypothetical protein
MNYEEETFPQPSRIILYFKLSLDSSRVTAIIAAVKGFVYLIEGVTAM